MNINIEDVLNRIDAILKERHETRKDFCIRANVQYQSFFDWKSRGTIPASDILYRIAKNLGVTMEYLLSGNDQLPDDIAIAASYLSGINEFDRKPIIQALKAVYEYYNPTN